MKKEIGYRIRKIRESKDYSQENMGDELGITAGAYAKIERGETDPSITRIIKIAEILKVDPTFFLKEAHLIMQEAPVKYDVVQLTEAVTKLSREIDNLKTEIKELKKPKSKKYNH